MIDINKKYRTRSGNEVVIFTTESPDYRGPVSGAIKYSDTVWGNRSWSSLGVFHPGVEDAADLIEVNPLAEFERWAVIDIGTVPKVFSHFSDAETYVNQMARHCTIHRLIIDPATL